jgi:DNA-binding transcriptional MerR regulator
MVYLSALLIIMLNTIKTKFSIKDLENFTGIKSHTIRIWEKRYKLLKPSRTDTNIRFYDSDNFLKLLNVNLLYKNGFKISKIAQLSEASINTKVKELVSNKVAEERAIDAFKIAMINFDSSLFQQTYSKLSAYKSFKEIFYDVFIPLLDNIGYLWQTKTIKPVHEHFISSLIVQKLNYNIEQNLSKELNDSGKVFVLYLPMGEIHELGLLFLHYELTFRGYHSIYLGSSISMDQITDIKDIYTSIHFISYFTVEPSDDVIDNYLDNVFNQLLSDTKNQFYFLGMKSIGFIPITDREQIRSFPSIDDLLKYI